MRAWTSYERERKTFFPQCQLGCEGCGLHGSDHGPHLQCGEEGARFRLGADSQVVRIGTHGWLFSALGRSFPTMPMIIRSASETLGLGDGSFWAFSVVDGTSSPPSLSSPQHRWDWRVVSQRL